MAAKRLLLLQLQVVAAAAALAVALVEGWCGCLLRS
jgi:hypothetical protein